MLTQQQKDDWIAALRSGEFEQGARRLFDSANDSYCCLGVLAKINSCSVKGSTLNEFSHAKIIPVELCSYETSTLVPLASMLPGATSHFSEDNKFIACESLAHLNDRGATFEDIAKLIELYLPVAAAPAAPPNKE